MPDDQLAECHGIPRISPDRVGHASDEVDEGVVAECFGMLGQPRFALAGGEGPEAFGGVRAFLHSVCNPLPEFSFCCRQVVLHGLR